MKRSAVELVCFAIVVFLSAFLLFAVQPLISKIILPWFGGSTGVWAVCLVFFQTMLCIGYAYAFLLQKFVASSKQWKVHAILLASGIACLPIMPSNDWKPIDGNDPMWRIGMILLAKVGVPYLALSSTGPLLQAWFARTNSASQTYRLFALSNAGSLLSLVLFPFLFEPTQTLKALSFWWSIGYVLFALFCLFVAWRSRGDFHWSDVRSNWTNDEGLKEDEFEIGEYSLPISKTVVFSISIWDMLLWLVLPAIASFMLVAGTNHLCQDVASIPFLWITPLSLYLLSFIICFDAIRWYSRGVMVILGLVGSYFAFSLTSLDNADELGRGSLVRASLPITKGILSWLGWYEPKVEIGTWATWLRNQTIITSIEIDFIGQVLIICLLLFGTFMICHGELAKRKPPTHFLTLYYLMIAIGGAIGGAVVTLIAPLIFNDVFEWPLGLFFVTLALCGFGFDWKGMGSNDRNYLFRFLLCVVPVLFLISVAVWQNSTIPTRLASWIEPLSSQDVQKSSGHAERRFSIAGAVAVWSLIATLGVLGVIQIRSRNRLTNWLRSVVINASWLLLVLGFWNDLLVFTSIDKVFEQWKTGPNTTRQADKIAWQGRNFYGALTIHRSDESKSGDGPMRLLQHGRISHGSQFENPPASLLATTYYGPATGIGIAMKYFENLETFRVGTIGLGTGTLMAYASPNGSAKQKSRFTVYEINPMVVGLSEGSQPWFTYIRDAKKRGSEIEIVQGDARIMLERESARSFDLLSVDAFSSDSIPTHLLTREAIQTYQRHLTPLGILAIHISNRYLDLEPVCRGLSEFSGLESRLIQSEYGTTPGAFSSSWVMMTASSDFIQMIDESNDDCRPLNDKPPIYWTDDFTNLFDLLK